MTRSMAVLVLFPPPATFYTVVRLVREFICRKYILSRVSENAINIERFIF